MKSEHVEEDVKEEVAYESCWKCWRCRKIYPLDQKCPTDFTSAETYHGEFTDILVQVPVVKKHPAGASPSQQHWKCFHCNYTNDESSDTCTGCKRQTRDQSPKTSVSQEEVDGKKRMQQGHPISDFSSNACWVCQRCDN